MNRLYFLLIILAIVFAYKMTTVKIDRDFYRLENMVYEDIANIYETIGDQNDLIKQAIK